jgi:hypothetical protein
MMNDLDDSEAPSDFEKHVLLPPKTTETLTKDDVLSSKSTTTPTDRDVPAIGHRLNASRSVLALALDEECVYAGLQGGDILVSHVHLCQIFRKHTDVRQLDMVLRDI